jgi:hypothetical protein
MGSCITLFVAPLASWFQKRCQVRHGHWERQPGFIAALVQSGNRYN